jgi:hypothetical protein
VNERFKTIYFFGAGASAAELPTSPTNFALYLSLRDGLKAGDPHLPTLREFLAGWLGAENDEMLTIEELLSVLDGCLTKGEPIGQAWSISRLAKCREELINFIYGVIGESSDYESVDVSDKGLYLRLLQELPDRPVSLISMNYDLLLDQALYRVGRAPDYDLDFKQLPNTTAARRITDQGHPSQPPIKLFKLHGSLNWGYCEACFTTVMARTRTIGDGQPCPTCDGNLRALIIPPSPIKSSPSPFLSALWKKAEWELTQAQEIVFIGYSLSDADANIRYLLFRGFFGTRPRVTVVLNEQDRAVAGRYSRLFPGCVTFCWDGFEGYLGG